MVGVVEGRPQHVQVLRVQVELEHLLFIDGFVGRAHPVEHTVVHAFDLPMQNAVGLLVVHVRLVEHEVDLRHLLETAKLVGSVQSDFEVLGHVDLHFAFDVDHEQVHVVEQKGADFAIVLGVSPLGRVEPLRVDQNQVLDRTVWVAHLLNGQVESTRAPPLAGVEERPEHVVEQRRLAAALRAHAPHTAHLRRPDPRGKVDEERRLELETLPVDQFQCESMQEQVDEPALQPLLSLLLEPCLVFGQKREQVPEQDLDRNGRAQRPKIQLLNPLLQFAFLFIVDFFLDELVLELIDLAQNGSLR